MALEVEYADMDSFENVVAPDADPDDLVNGDGSSVDEQTEFQPEESAPSLAYELPAASNQDEEATLTTPGPLAPEWMNREQCIEFYRSWVFSESSHNVAVANAKEKHSSLAVKRSELENELKDIKADEKAALRNLRNLIKRGPNYPQPKSKIDEAVSAAGEPSDTTWRELSLAPLLDGIKGLGAKKLDALLELCPTIGDWEELRAKAGVAHKPVSDVLPKGIGGSITNEIEERVYLAIKKHQDGLLSA